MTIHIDDAGVMLPGLHDRKLEKAFGRNRIAIWGEQEVNGVADRPMAGYRYVHCPATRDLDLVDAPRTVGIPHFGPDPFIQHRCVPEHPPSDDRMIDRKATLGIISSRLR